jgi:general secretion pathway protein A
MEHLAHFGFKEEPFRMTPDRDFYFPSTNQTAISEVIRFGLGQGEGFIIVVGEVGTGKTMLLRFLTGDLTEKYDTALILSPHFTPKELLLAILRDIDSVDVTGSEYSLDDLLRILNEYLYELSKRERKLLVIIDEAQNLPEESIEQLRLLSNFESDKQKLLQIILVGQPELQEKLEKKNLRQFLQRVSIMETLNPLSKVETTLYVHFRFRIAGNENLRLTKAARTTLWRYTNGVPRLINRIMSRALLIAYAKQKEQIDKRVLREAISMLKFSRRIRSRWLPRFTWKLATVVTLLGLSCLLSFVTFSVHI